MKLEPAQNQNLGPLLNTTLTAPPGFVMDVAYLDIARRRRHGKKSFSHPRKVGHKSTDVQPMWQTVQDGVYTRQGGLAKRLAVIDLRVHCE